MTTAEEKTIEVVNAGIAYRKRLLLACKDSLKRTGVSLVEMLVVLTIIGILIGMLLPAIQRLRQTANETVCRNNIHQMVIAIESYREIHGRIPNPGIPDKVNGWMVEILPYIEGRNLHDILPLNSDLNEVDEDFYQPPQIYRCPVAMRFNLSQGIQRSHYVLIDLEERRKFMVGDTPIEINIPWLEGAEMELGAWSALPGPHRYQSHQP